MLRKYCRMTKEHSQNGSCHRCGAPKYKNFKELVSNPVIRTLRDKIELLNFRLQDCKSENRMLLRNLKLTKMQKCEDVRSNESNFQNISPKILECTSNESKEILETLKANINELLDHLKQLEAELPNTPQERFKDLTDNHNLSSEKKLWRLQLEYRLERKNAEKDIKPLVNQCSELRKGVDREKNLFNELNDEIKFLRTEMKNQTVKCKRDVQIMHSISISENQLQKTLNEIEGIRQELEGSQSRNMRLIKELVSLKDELEMVKKKSKDNRVLIDYLTTFQKNMQEAIDNEKLIELQSVDRYDSDIKILKENCKINDEILDLTQCIIHDWSTLLDELKIKVESKFGKNIEQKKCEKKMKSDDDHKTKMNHMVQSHLVESQKTDFESENDDQNNQSILEMTIRNLVLESEKYKSLYNAVQMKSQYLQQCLSVQESIMNLISTEALNIGSLFIQINCEKKEMIQKIKKLQKSLEVKRREGTFYVHPKDRLEELRCKVDIQIEENDYLRNFLRSVLCNKFKDLLRVKKFASDIQGYFQMSLCQIKNSIAGYQVIQKCENV